MRDLDRWLSSMNPSPGFIEDIRHVNIVLGCICLLALLVVLARPRWREWSVPTRLGFQSLCLFCLTGIYGTVEAAFLSTFLRVPMVTVAFCLGIAAAVWPREDSSK